MQENKYKLLCTNAVAQELIESAAEQGIDMHVIPFIKTQSVRDNDLGDIISQLSGKKITVVFSSRNAVESVKAYLSNSIPPWKIWCLSGPTQKSVKRYFGEGSVMGTESRAIDLADSILASGGIRELVFFCGERRRNELPEILRKFGIRIDEIIVYKTDLAPHPISMKYDGIIFFSPSAVHSFFSVNLVSDTSVFFAIGKTTAETIKIYSNNQIIIAGTPGKDLLIENALAYFRTHPIQKGLPSIL